jgi:geranylgeranyl diphosphate synthase type I
VGAVPDVGSLEGLRERGDRVLRAFLDERRAVVAELDPAAAPLVDEIVRVVEAGGARIRPAFVYWSHAAAGGSDGEPILRAGGAVELLHTMALIHDDLIDGSPTRRGAPASHVAVGRAVALLAGDLAAVLADELLRTSGFAEAPLAAARARYDRMRVEMAAGQYLALVDASTDPGLAASLRGGRYTVLGPLLIGAELAGADQGVLERLAAYGEPLGRAFQLRDDLRDGEAAPSVDPATIEALVERAVGALDPARLGDAATAALATLAWAVAA